MSSCSKRSTWLGISVVFLLSFSWRSKDLWLFWITNICHWCSPTLRYWRFHALIATNVLLLFLTKRFTLHTQGWRWCLNHVLLCALRVHYFFRKGSVCFRGIWWCHELGLKTPFIQEEKNIASSKVLTLMSSSTVMICFWIKSTRLQKHHCLNHHPQSTEF